MQKNNGERTLMHSYHHSSPSVLTTNPMIHVYAYLNGVCSIQYELENNFKKSLIISNYGGKDII